MVLNNKSHRVKILSIIEPIKKILPDRANFEIKQIENGKKIKNNIKLIFVSFIECIYKVNKINELDIIPRCEFSKKKF